MNESDCTKWLTNFEEKTNTHWKVDKDASRVVSQTHKVRIKLVNWYKYPTQEHKLTGDENLGLDNIFSRPRAASGR